ncbi:hypothetical protein COCCADRAFT_30452 [Bipolaris zeicola 26-R-13]|uniref:NB-ARC domain-containing protein n=1 Tax=Cochliobolus carbonum (strain 26-R-13) TaxID=930089 RepID=W6XRL7_COCC2|nr:uncharacterized protein COCCADRAFT_30452 [Bipolaris zeicola 26-R-13]EUC28238.1 hypothetical protein COCCADRAFT_30452 [Bipolaris zeicola 26-R-13]
MLTRTRTNLGNRARQLRQQHMPCKELLQVIKKQGVDAVESASFIGRGRLIFSSSPKSFSSSSSRNTSRMNDSSYQYYMAWGGIGKTQLAVKFARPHHCRFSAVFWLDGRSEGSIKRSTSRCASKTSQRQIPKASRTYAPGGGDGIDAIVKHAMSW